MKCLENRFFKMLRRDRSFNFFSRLSSVHAGVSGLAFLPAFVLRAKGDASWEEAGVPFTHSASPQGVQTEQPAAQPGLRCCHH